jgi:hypothetical protein
MRGVCVLLLIAGCRGEAPSPSPPPSGSAKPSPVDETADVTRTTKTGAVTYTYRASRMTYLVYTLDCLAEIVPCSPDATMWSDQRAEDEDALRTWQELRQRYSGEISDRQRVSRAVLPIPYHDRDVGTAIRVAGFGARDTAELAVRLSLFMGAAEVASATKVVERFAPRIDAHWRSARASVVASLDDYVKLGERADVQALLGQIAAFYAIGDRGAYQTFDLVNRPDGKGSTSAQQLGELAVVEVIAGESAAGRYSVIAHEMFHAWFGASPIESQVALVDRLVATGDPIAGPAWGLFDEVLATALGNGLVARLVDRADYDKRLAQDGGFYNDPFIDKVAKALLPALEKRLANKGTVYDPEFVTEYLAAVHAAFPDGLPPVAYLRPLFIAVPGPDTNHLMDVARPGYSESFDTIEESIAEAPRLVGWGTVVFTRRADLDKLSAFVSKSALEAVKKVETKEFVYAWRRKPVGTVFLFVIDRVQAANELVDALAKLKAPLREGVIVP